MPLSRREFDGLVREVRPALLRFVGRYAPASDAEDIVQDALASAWLLRERYAPTTGTPGLLRWLAPILRNAVRRYYQRFPLWDALGLDAEAILAVASRPEAEAALPDLSSAAYLAEREALLRLLARVTLSGVQELCVRQWLEGVSQAQIAVYLGVTQPAVRYQIAKACVYLREAREPEPDLDVQELLREVWEETHRLVYTRPVGVWDREGNAEERAERHSVAGEARYERRQERRRQQEGW